MAVTVTKTCSRCQQAKPVEGWYTNPTTADGLHSWCRECHADRGRERYYRQKADSTWAARNREATRVRTAQWRERNPDRVREITRGVHYKRNYGITVEDYNRLLESQGGACAICQATETRTMAGKTRRLSVDHDHETGAVRGLLCGGCNSGVGYFRDNPDRLRNAITYLTSRRESPCQ